MRREIYNIIDPSYYIEKLRPMLDGKQMYGDMWMSMGDLSRIHQDLQENGPVTGRLGQFHNSSHNGIYNPSCFVLH